MSLQRCFLKSHRLAIHHWVGTHSSNGKHSYSTGSASSTTTEDYTIEPKLSSFERLVASNKRHDEKKMNTAQSDVKFEPSKPSWIDYNREQMIDNYPDYREFVPDMSQFRKFDNSFADHLEHQASTPLMPASSSSLAGYINHSEVLQSLVQFGVNLHKVGKVKRGYSLDMLVKLTMSELRAKLFFLNQEFSVKPEEFGRLITANAAVLGPKVTPEDMRKV